MANLTSIFHRLPYPGRVLAASARGLYLRRWRYGRETRELVVEAGIRERWSRDEWDAWQTAQLEKVLTRAVRFVPYYRQLWEERRRRGDDRSWRKLENWPVLRKETVRSHPELFVAEDRRSRTLFRFHTSGSTGTPLSLWISRSNLRQWYALSEARWRGWHGVSRDDRWVIFGGQLVVPAEAAKAPFWVWNQGLRQLYVSSIHVAPWSVLEIARAIDKSGAIYVLGYPSALFEFAKIALENAIATPKMKVVISNAEPLFEFQRQVIQEAFGAPVVDTYGLAEMVAAAGECEVGGLHLWPDAGVVEILADDEDKPLADGQVGRLIGTGLVNDDMPLIRYEVGDRGSLKPARFFCDCGRKLPVLGEVQGRLDDLVVTPDGRRVGRLDHAFKKDLPIRAAQVMQESLHSIKVLVEPAAGFDQRAREEIARSLRDRLGDMNIEVEEVSLIPRGASGKLRGVVSRITTGS